MRFFYFVFRGCFLTSSLVATLSLSLTIPMTMIADIIIKGVRMHITFFVWNYVGLMLSLNKS